MYQSADYFNEKFPFPETKESEEIRRLEQTLAKLEHDLFFLHVYLASEGNSEEACSFLEEHEDYPLPFRL